MPEIVLPTQTLQLPDRQPDRVAHSSVTQELETRSWLPTDASATGEAEPGLVIIETATETRENEHLRTQDLAVLSTCGLSRAMELLGVRVGRTEDGKTFHTYSGSPAFIQAFNQLPTPGLPADAKPLGAAAWTKLIPYYNPPGFVRNMAAGNVTISCGRLARRFRLPADVVNLEAHDTRDHGPAIAIFRNSVALTAPLVEKAKAAQAAYEAAPKLTQVGRWIGAIATGKFTELRQQRRQAIDGLKRLTGAFDKLSEVSFFAQAYKKLDPESGQMLVLDAPNRNVLESFKDEITYLYGPDLERFSAAVQDSLASYATLS